MGKLTKAPEIKINWGMQDLENQKEWKNWVFKNLCTINKNEDLSPTELKELAFELFDEIHQCGYEEGYDSAKCDNEGEGLWNSVWTMEFGRICGEYFVIKARDSKRS